MPSPGLLQSMYNYLRAKFIILNLFDSRSPDPAIIRRGILSTRLFLFLLVVSVFILTLSTSLMVQLKSETVKQPVQAVYDELQKKYPNTLQCPCAKISIPYGTFVSIVQSFHQVCSSDFVSQSWIDFAFAANTTFIWRMDVRTSLSAMWQLIAALCHSANDTLMDVLNEFANLPLISPMTLPKELLQAKTQLALDSVRRTASDTLARPLLSINRVVQANMLMTGLSTNYAAVFTTRHGEPGWLTPVDVAYNRRESKTVCSCLGVTLCPIPGGLYLYNVWDTRSVGYNLKIIMPNETLSGIMVDCLPVQMMLASSLECFYNQSCLNILLAAYPRSIDVSILNKSLPSRFVPTTNIEVLINELFIEQILNETNYNLYYLQCAPIYCSYTFLRRFDWIYVATTLIALVGGLSTALQLITPHLIDLILFLKRKLRCIQMESQQNESISIRTHLKNLLKNVKRSILSFNLFDNYSRDPYRILCGRIATWLYVTLLLCVISIVIGYMSLTVQTLTKTIDSPSQEEYEDLEQRYPNTLQCPCTNISIRYEEFIQVTPTYHQLCESDFIQPWWYNSLSSEFLVFIPSLFNFAGSSRFQILATFCEIANLTVTDASRGFFSTSFVNAQVLPRRMFDSQTNAIIDTFLNSTRVGFLNTILLINAVLQANQYISGVFSNTAELRTMYFPQLNLSELDPVRVISSSFTIVGENGENCYCARNATCSKALDPDEFGDSMGPGLLIGCSIMNSVLISSLECWYSDSCTHGFIMNYNENDVDVPENVTILDATRRSRFPPSIPVQIIVNEMMVEQWNRSVSYVKFYHKCHPAFCSFTYEDRMNVAYIVAMIVGLFGGLDLILRWISLGVVKIFFKCINRISTGNPLQVSSNQETTDRE